MGVEGEIRQGKLYSHLELAQKRKKYKSKTFINDIVAKTCFSQMHLIQQLTEVS